MAEKSGNEEMPPKQTVTSELKSNPEDLSMSDPLIDNIQENPKSSKTVTDNPGSVDIKSSASPAKENVTEIPHQSTGKPSPSESAPKIFPRTSATLTEAQLPSTASDDPKSPSTDNVNNVTKSPAPETPTKSPAPEIPTKSPAPETPTKSPAPETPTKSPAPETPTKSPAPETPTKSPAPETPTKSPAPETPTKSPAPETPTKSPALETPTKSPAPETPTKSPAPETPTKSLAPETPTKSPAPETPTKSLAPETPTKSLAPETPTKSPAPEIPTKSPAPEIPTKSPAPEIPTKKTKSPAPHTPTKPTNFFFPDKNSESLQNIEDSNVLNNESDPKNNSTTTTVTSETSNPSPAVSKKKSLSFKETTKGKNEPGKPKEKEDKIALRSKTVKNDDRKTPQNRASFMMKTKGNLFYKKKGPFRKWKQHFIILDDCKMQMSFFKSQEEYENLASCKLPIDLRFVTEIKCSRPNLLQSNFPFKLQRRAGLSTVKLAAHNEEERARWITTIERIMRKIEVASEMDIILEEKRSSTLPNSLKSSVRLSSDSGTQTSTSAPDQEELIAPRKLSSKSGFKVNPHQITSIKLKQVTVEKEANKMGEKIEEDDDDGGVGGGDKDDISPKEPFGVSLRRVQTEKAEPRKEREQSPEYKEFKEKYNSLSLSRKNKIPKLPLNENLTCSHLVENISIQDFKKSERTQLGKESKEPYRKRSPSPNIPISKAVEAVIKNKGTDENAQSLQDDRKFKFSVCHATSAIISFDESPVLEIGENTKKESLTEKRDSVSSSSVTNKTESPKQSKYPIIAKRPDILEPSRIIPTIKLNAVPEGKKTKVICNQHEEGYDYFINETHDKNSTKDDDLTMNQTSNNCDLEIQNIVDDLKSIVKKESQDIDSRIENKAFSEPNNSYIKHNDANNETEGAAATSSDTENIECRKIAGIMTQNEIDSIVRGKSNTKTDVSNSLRRNNELFISDRKINPEIRSSTHSYQSQISTESDEPLPRLNFLGKGDRSSSSSASAKDSEEGRIEKSFDLDESSDQSAIVRDKSPKPHSYLSTDSSNNKETRSSLVLPEFTVVEERAEELLLESTKNEPNFNNNSTAPNKTDNILNSEDPDHKVKGTCEMNEKDDDNLNESGVCEDNVEIRSNIEVKITEEIRKFPEQKLPAPNANENVLTPPDNETKRVNDSEELKMESDNKLDTFDNKNINLSLSPKIADGNGKTSPSTEKTPKITTHTLVLKRNDSTEVKGEITTKDGFSADLKEPVKLAVNATEQESLKSENTIKETFKENEQNVPVQSIKTERIVPEEEDEKSNENKQLSISEDNTKEKEVLKEVESEETLDYFPSFERPEYRVKDGKLSTSEGMRTSGITDLKNFLKENDSDISQTDVKAGISRLGHSPAIEKLRKEIP